MPVLATLLILFSPAAKSNKTTYGLGALGGIGLSIFACSSSWLWNKLAWKIIHNKPRPKGSKTKLRDAPTMRFTASAWLISMGASVGATCYCTGKYFDIL